MKIRAGDISYGVCSNVRGRVWCVSCCQLRTFLPVLPFDLNPTYRVKNTWIEPRRVMVRCVKAINSSYRYRTWIWVNLICLLWSHNWLL